MTLIIIMDNWLGIASALYCWLIAKESILHSKLHKSIILKALQCKSIAHSTCSLVKKYSLKLQTSSINLKKICCKEKKIEKNY